jgi:hypothetical protein
VQEQWYSEKSVRPLGGATLSRLTTRKISPAVSSWACSILTAVVAMFVTFGFAEGLPLSPDQSATIGFLAHDLLVATACFFICRWNPRNILLTFFFCNGVGIIAACTEPTFWRDAKWIIFGIGWLFSSVTALVGAKRGREIAAKRTADDLDG